MKLVPVTPKEMVNLRLAETEHLWRMHEHYVTTTSTVRDLIVEIMARDKQQGDFTIAPIEEEGQVLPLINDLLDTFEW